MKRFNILQLFSKKGVLVLGLVVGMMLSLFCCQSVSVSAHEAENDSDTIEKPADYPTGQNEYGYLLISGFTTGTYWNGYVPISGGLSMDFSPDIEKICLYKDGNGSNDGGAWTRYRVASAYEKIEANYVYNWHFGSDPGRFAVSDIVMHEITKSYVYIFNTGSEASQYLSGNLDPSNALNYDDLQAQKEVLSGIDDSLPYFDKSVMQLNQNNSVTYQSSMSPDMQTEFYEMCAKVADKDDSGHETEHYNAYVEMTATALYADRKALGLFNSSALELAGTAVNKEKLDDVIQFGSDGRIEVASFVGHSGGGGRRSLTDSMFHEKSDAPLIAVEVDSIALSDRNSSFPGVVRNLSAKQNLVDASLEGYSPLFGTVMEYSAYTLVGYAADVRIIYYDVLAGTYTASRDTYTYTWVYTTLQDRYGSGTIGYDSEGNIVSKNEFDNLNSDVGGSWGTLPDYEESADGVLNNIKNGFGLLGNNGLLALCQRTFTAIPLWIWVLVGMLISVNIIVIGLKIARGM